MTLVFRGGGLGGRGASLRKEEAEMGTGPGSSAHSVCSLQALQCLWQVWEAAKWGCGFRPQQRVWASSLTQVFS